MPQPISNDAIVEVSFVGRHAGQRTLNLLHYKAKNIVGPIDFTSLVADLQAGIMGLGGLVEAYSNCISMDWRLEGVRWQVITPNRFAFHWFPLADNPGGIEVASLPPNDGGVIIKRNDLTGRRNRGIVHMPGMPGTWVVDGLLTSAAINAYQQFGDEMIVPLVVPQSPDPSGSLEPVIFNKGNPTFSPVFTSATPQSTARVNRRRTVGVGE